ncbi:MAG: Hsp33 family molecular chaperone HslO, partial [Bacillota bacterium]
AGGFIVQLMPDASEKTVDKLEKNIKKINSVSRLIESGLKPEELLEKILGEFNFRIMAKKDVKFKCKCSRERIYNLIAGLGEDELKEALAEQGEVEVKCHFCSSKYSFSKEEVEELLEKTAEED